MIRIAHLSDLHFGREIPALVEGLIELFRAELPDLIVISGDLTQRARAREFRAAREFLDRLPAPYLVVPGNHDIPAYPLTLRFVLPWRRWQQWLAVPLEPVVTTERFCAVGVNSARRWGPYLDWSRGRVGIQQLDRIESVLATNSRPCNIVVAHHPFLMTEASAHRRAIGRADMALPRLRQAGVDLILGGHVHLAYAGVAHGIVVAQTGTTVSSRLKGEPNSLNRIEIVGDAMVVDTLSWDGVGFRSSVRHSFQRTASGWAAQSTVASLRR